MSKICTECNTENVDEAKFCRRCGKENFKNYTPVKNKVDVEESLSKASKKDVPTIIIIIHAIFTYLVIYILTFIVISVFLQVFSLYNNALIFIGAFGLNFITSYFLTLRSIKKHYLAKQQQSTKSSDNDDTMVGYAVIIVVVLIVTTLVWLLS